MNLHKKTIHLKPMRSISPSGQAQANLTRSLVLDEQIVDGVALRILEGKISSGQQVIVDEKNGKLEIKTKSVN